ncbi:hypothetical protein EJ02DRAFT_461162 [Clathrospora elynae]|uniref:Uncharacterized protein n=1 Tax=Clathrospora elynae TaxID=706981 RepID=A0A6A5T4Q8_9PLEO|nr:hypothetical protein EJ02DRAFT_461162 [Clathrospora elynae]
MAIARSFESNSTSSSLSLSLTGSSSSKPTASSSPASAPNSSSKLGGGAIAGIVIGEIFSIALILAADIFVVKKRRDASTYPATSPHETDKAKNVMDQSSVVEHAANHELHPIKEVDAIETQFAPPSPAKHYENRGSEKSCVK